MKAKLCSFSFTRKGKSETYGISKRSQYFVLLYSKVSITKLEFSQPFSQARIFHLQTHKEIGHAKSRQNLTH